MRGSPPLPRDSPARLRDESDAGGPGWLAEEDHIKSGKPGALTPGLPSGPLLVPGTEPTSVSSVAHHLPVTQAPPVPDTPGALWAPRFPSPAGLELAASLF